MTSGGKRARDDETMLKFLLLDKILLTFRFDENQNIPRKTDFVKLQFSILLESFNCFPDSWRLAGTKYFNARSRSDFGINLFEMAIKMFIEMGNFA